jgi:hypothetical protein
MGRPEPPSETVSMISKVPLTLFVSAVLAFACGPRARNEATTPEDAQRVMRATSDAPLVPSLAVNVASRRK